MANNEVKVIISADDKATKEISKVEKSLGSSFSKISKIAIAGFASITTAIGFAIKSAVTFDSRIGDLATLLGDNTEALDAYAEGIRNISKVVPKSADELGAAAYQIVSAGISDVSKALKVLEYSGKLAVAGLGDTTSAVDLMTSAINAFQLDAEKSDKVANTIFATVKAGKTTVDELAQSFGMVAPLAAQMGVSFEELQAATAALTTTGLKTSVAQTQIRASLQSLLKPTKDMQLAFQTLGVSSGQELLKQSDNFVDAFNQIRNALGNNDSALASAFGSIEGLNAVLSLTGATAESFIGTLGEMTSGVDVMSSAFSEQADRVSKRWQILKNTFNDLGITIGDILIPIVQRLLDVVMVIINGFSSWVEKQKELGMSLEDLFSIIDEKTGFVTVLKDAWNSIAQTFQEFLLPQLKKLWEALQPMMPFLQALGQVIKFGVALAIDGLILAVEGWIQIFTHLLTVVTGVATYLVDNLAKGIEFIISVVEKAITAVMKLIDAFSQLGFVGGVKSIGSKIMNSISGLFKADGGPVSANSPYIVGERGPELFMPNVSGSIIPNNRLAGSSNITINISGNTLLDGSAGDKLADQIMRRLKQNIKV